MKAMQTTLDQLNAMPADAFVTVLAGIFEHSPWVAEIAAQQRPFESIDALHAYTYRTAHAEVYAARRQWFAETKAVVGGHALAMWWIRPGEIPTVADAKARLDDITANGPSERAFTFKKRFPPPA